MAYNEREYNNVNKGKFNPVIEVTRELKDKYPKKCREIYDSISSKREVLSDISRSKKDIIMFKNDNSDAWIFHLDEIKEEYMGDGDYYEYYNTIHFQAINCKKCGNYRNPYYMLDKITCNGQCIA